MALRIESIVGRRGYGVAQRQEIVLIGLQLSNGRIAWGDCVADPYTAIPFTAQYGLEAIETYVRPRLRGQTVTSISALMMHLEGIRETVLVTETHQSTPPQPKGPSRRDILRGSWQPTTAVPESIIRRYEVERPLHPALRYGLSQALLQAVALAQDKSLLAVLCDTYDLPMSPTAVPLHAEINPHLPLDIATITQNPIQSVGYSTGGANPSLELGPNGTVLQRFVRQLKESLLETADPQTLAFYLTVRGGYGHLCDNNLGKILGMLVGLEKAAEPFLVRIQDPFVLDEQAEQIKQMANLKSYLRSRSMKLQLVAQAGIHSAADALAFVAGDAAHMLHLHLPQMGDIGEGIKAAKICQENGIGVLWGGSPEETEVAARSTVQTALAVQPRLLLVKNGRLGSTAASLMYNEMTRILAAVK